MNPKLNPTNLFKSIPGEMSKLNQDLPITFEKHKGIRDFEVPAGARGRRRASQNHKALAFSRVGLGPQALRLSLRNPFGSADQSEIPGRCFRESRRRPRAQSRLSSYKQRLKFKEVR
jgi:hypothetical protein